MNQVEPLRLKDTSPFPGKPFCDHLGGSLLGLKMDTKVCSKCGIEKPTSEFFKHSEHTDGLRSECKACTNIYKQAYTLKHYDKIIARKKAYYNKNKDTILTQKHIYAMKNRSDRLVYERKYRQDHPLRIRAKNAVNRAVKSGELIRPDNCSECGDECKPYGHHYLGYEKEHWLDVEWLCGSCHQTLHAKLRMEEVI